MPMLEQVVRRKFYLKRHLDAPLLKEREEYVTMLHDRGLSHQKLLTAADYTLRIVELLNLKDGDKSAVTLHELDAAAESWSKTILNHPMKRKSAPTSVWKFKTIATDWLVRIGRMDESYTRAKNICGGGLHDRIHFIRKYLDAPFFEERVSYLEDMYAKGFQRNGIKQAAAYQLHIIEFLGIKDLREITQSEVESAARSWCEATTTNIHKKPGSKYAFRRFMRFAKDWLDYLGLYKEKTECIPWEGLLSSYSNHLIQDLGYSIQTQRTRYSMLKFFLRYVDERESSPAELNLTIIDEYITKLASEGQHNRNTISSVASVLRSFLRYLSNNGWCPSGLDIGIKAPRRYAMEKLPSSPSWDTVKDIIADKGSDKPIDIRDRAMLLLLSVYGLRCSEVTKLKLKDIDWRAEMITLTRAKDCKPQIFPLQKEVGDAIIRYIKEVRPNQSGSEYVFLCRRAPYRRLTNAVVYHMVSSELKKRGESLDHYGPHTLRHACATNLINSGFTLKEIADHLGHQQLDTTRIYSKVDLVNLRKVADMDWKEVLS